MDRNIALEMVRVTEAAALSASQLMGRGDEHAADQVAVNAMRDRLNMMDISGTVVIGEGERDEAPMLYIGEKVGRGGPEIDIALDPLEGTTITARGDNNALAVIAAAHKGHFLNAPDVYMNKIAVGAGLKGVVSLTKSPTENLHDLADARRCRVSELTVIILDRPRHQALIEEVRKTGARIKMIQDGDVSAAIATAIPTSGVDILMGTGGAPEGVLAAAALQCLGGEIHGQLLFRNDDEKGRAKKMGITDFNHIYSINELASDEVIFSATGVTDGSLLKGVSYRGGSAKTHSVVMRSKTGTVRYITAHHHLNQQWTNYEDF